ncbi:MAG: hypothetical protein ATN31_02320 [Candidatus Epulonipiscioides saccharophilum]|nr:MAG: hypothetical protein ATN31_02320 [Epulopiscium sp. AS2M-Bin001]
MSLFKKYQKQIALALITSGVISSYPINVQATEELSSVTVKSLADAEAEAPKLGLPAKPSINIGAPRSTADQILAANTNESNVGATGTTTTMGDYEILGTIVAKAINYAQAMNISKIGGIEFNGGATDPIKDPSDPNEATKNAPAQQKYLDTSISDSSEAHAKLMAFFKPTVQSISSSLNVDDLKEIRTTLNNLVNNVEALTTIEDATGHDYYVALAELLQYIDTIDAHMDMAPALPTSLIVESNSKSTVAPAALDPNFTLDGGAVTNPAGTNPDLLVLETRPIHVSQFKGNDVPTNEHWISDSIYDDLKEAIDEATTIAQNVHSSALFATEALANTKTIGAIVNLNLKDTSANPVVDGIVLNPAHSRDPYASTQTVATPGDKSFGTPQGTDDNYSELDDLTDALTNLKDAYTAYVRDTATQKGTAEIAKNVLNAQAKLKATMAMSGMPGIWDATNKKAKSITDLITSLNSLVTTADEGNIGTADTNNSAPNTVLSQDNKIYVYVRKATSADITNTADVQDFRYLSSGTAIDAAAVTAGTLIVCTPDEAEDIALYQAPTATGHDLTAHCAPLVTYGDDKYFIAPMIKESSDHVPTWFLGGEYQVAGTPTTEKTAGTYITTAEATEQLKAIHTAITTYKLYDNVQDNGDPYTELDDLMGEIEAADDNLSDFIDDTLNERIETILDDIHKTGTGQLKDSAYLTLQKLMFHLGMATDDSGTFTLDTDLDESFGLPYQGNETYDEADLSTLRATPTASFELEKNAQGNDWADFMANGNGTDTAPESRKFHNVSDVYGINLAKADTWVTQEEHNTLYTEAKEAYEFIKTIDDHTDGQPELVEYKKTTTSAIQEHIDDLIEAIENYDDAAEDGNLEALKKDYDKLKAQVGQKENTPSGGLKYLELPTINNGKIDTARTLVSANKIAISDEGIFKITTESMTVDENPSGSAVIEQKQLFVANDHTHWVTPAEVTALQSPLQIASDLKNLLDLVYDFATPGAKDFSSLTTEQKATFAAFGKVFYEETENDAAYSISPITDNLKDAIYTFETAAEKEALEPTQYTTPRSELRTLLWGGTNSASPADNSIRKIVKTKVIPATTNGGEDTVHVYLAEDITPPETTGTPGPRTLVVSKDSGVTFEIFNESDNTWSNGGLLVAGTKFGTNGKHLIGAATKWISLDALKTYGNAILAAEKTLADSVPTAKVIASPGASATEPSEDAVKIDEAKLVTADTTTYTAISELSTETLNAIKAGTYFSSAKTTLEGAKTTFTNAQTTISADSAVAKAQKALADFKTKLGTANAGADGSDSKANGYIVGNATAGDGDKIIVAAIKNNAGNVTGYFPINVHQSEDGIARADNKGILDLEIASSVTDKKIDTFVNKATITALSDAFLAVDSLITKVETDLASDTDRSAMIENLNVGAKETPYLETTTEYTTLKGLIESYSPTESKAGAYKTAVENIAPPTDKTGLLDLLKKDVIPGSGISADTDIPLKFVTSGDITTLVFDESIAQYSLDGLYKANADGTAVNPQEDLENSPAKWVNPTSTTNLINALKAMNTLVTEANAVTSSSTTNNKAMKDHIAAFILDNDYFTKTSKYTDRTNALNAFKVGTVEVIDHEDLSGLVTKAKKLLYGEDGTVGGTNKDLLISAIEGKDLLTLDELKAADKDGTAGLSETEIATLGTTGQLKYVTADYAKTLTDSITEGENTELDQEGKTKAAKALAVAINKYEAELKTMDITSDNHEIALYNSYVSIKPVLYYTDSKDAEQKVMSDNKNGANTEIGKKWLAPKEYEKADETYTDIESLLANTSHTNVARFINDASDLIEDAQIVATYEPKEGTLDPTLAAQIDTALGNLANAINSLASTIGANEYIVEENKELTENKNTVKDTENMIYPSFLLGTDIEGSDSADDNDLLPDAGKKWLPPVKINEARSSISTALNTYKNRQSLVIINNKTTELNTLVSTLKSTAQFGSKGIYDDVAKHIEKYLILMTDGLAKQNDTTDNNGVITTYSEIIPLGKISREENGEEVWPINYWASPEEYMAIMAVYMECDNILANKANLVDRKITLPLADLINYYSKIKTAFENFYAVDITGANIEGKTSKVQTGTKGILDGVLTAEITKAEAQVNGLCFILGTEIEGYTGTSTVDDPLTEFYVSANGLDVPANYRWYDLADVQTYVDAIKLAKETKPATPEILNSLKDAIANFETKLQPVSSGNTDPVAQEFLAAQTKAKAALKIAYNLIGFTFDEDSYTTSADVEDNTEATFDANLQAPTGMTFNFIKESESGNGTDISEINYWVAPEKFEEYKEKLAGFVNLAKTAEDKESLTKIITGLTSTVHSLMNSAYRMGVGSLENMAIAENDLRKLVTKCLFLRDGKKHEDNDTYNPIFDGSPEDSLYTTYWPNLHADGYILSASMNGRDVSKQGYWAMTMLYYNFSANLNAAMNLVNRITAKEGVTISNVEQIIANLNKVLNYVAPNGKPRIGSSTITSGTDENKVDKAKEKAELRVIVDQTKMLISKVIETDPSKGAISVDNGVQWITNKAIGKVGPEGSTKVASQNFKDKAPMKKLQELIEAANVKLRKPVKADSDFSHSDLDKAVDEFEAIISGNEYKYTPTADGSEQIVAYHTYKYGGTGIKTPALGQAVEILETRVAAMKAFMTKVKPIILTTSTEQIKDNAEYKALAEGAYYINIPHGQTENTTYKALETAISDVGTAIKGITKDTVIDTTLTGGSTDGETVPDLENGKVNNVLSKLNAAFEKVAGKLDIEISFAFGGKNQTFKYSGEMGDGVNNDGSVGNSDVSADTSAPLQQKVTETGTVQPGVNLGDMATKIKNLFMASNRVVIPYESVTDVPPTQSEVGKSVTTGMISNTKLIEEIAKIIKACGIENDVVEIEVTTEFPTPATLDREGKVTESNDSADIGTVSSVTGEAGKNTVYNGSNFKIKLTEMTDSDYSAEAEPANSYDFNFGEENSETGYVIVDGTTSLHVEVAAPKFNYWNDLEKMDILRAATILYSNRGKLSVHAETGLDEAGIKTKLAAQITAMLTEAGFSNISAEIKPEIVESPKDSEDQKSLAGGELLDELGENPKAPAENKFAAGKQFKFTVSLIGTPKPTFTPEVDLLPQPAAQQELGARVSTTIEYKLYEEFGTADTYKVTFIDSGAQSKAKPEKHDAFTITIAANNSPDVSSVTTLMDKINAGAFSTIQGNTIADKHVADTAIMATVNELLKDLDLTGVSIEIIESGDGYPAGTGDYAFQIKITKGKVTQLSDEIKITNIPEPAAKAMATFYEPIEDEYLHYMDTDGQVEVEPDFDYYYEAEFVEEFVAEEFEVEAFEEIFEDDLSSDFEVDFEVDFEIDFEGEEEELLLF